MGEEEREIIQMTNKSVILSLILFDKVSCQLCVVKDNTKGHLFCFLPKVEKNI